MAALTYEDLEHARAIWEERVGDGFSLEVQIVGEHSAGMDPDRPLGAIVKARVDLLLTITTAQGAVIFSEPCPYEREALLASVRALSARLLSAG